MSRLLIRRCSMSSIEEEDESAALDDATTETERLPTPPPSSASSQQELYRSPSSVEWDSELSESDGEEGDQHSNDDDEEQAANRVLQSFMQSSTRVYLNPMANERSCTSPFSIHLHEEEDDSPELNAILSELRDFNAEFDQTHPQHLPKKIKPSTMNYYPSTATSKSPAPLSTSSCVHELRTLEDQLEAALASLTLTINDCSAAQADAQAPQRSSDSSACSSGLGEEIGNESFHLYSTANINQPNASFSSKCANGNNDDCDSAFSDSGSTGKVVPPHHDDSVIYRSIIPSTDPAKETPPIILDLSDSVSSHPQHPSKILVRTYNDDGSTKSIFIDDSMFIRDVLLLLVQKNHREADVNYALIEILPDLHMERIFEDHHKLMEAILMWPTVSSNRLSFTKRLEKYHFFRTLSTTNDLLQFPDIEGNVYLKEKSRKSWKKHFCVLRSSGLYFVPKGKSKKDLVCLAKFENVELFFGLEWKKKFKSPSDFCFALKHPLIQKKSSKYIKYMCVETKADFDRWITSIRIAKFGQQLKANYSFMEQAMSGYRLTGRFAAMCPTRSETPIEQQHPIDVPIAERRTPISQNHYYAIHSTVAPANDTENDDEQKSPIKSASYMDELRQRLERVLNESSSQRASPVQSLLHITEPIRRPTLLPPPPPASKLKPTNLPYVDSTPIPSSKKSSSIKSPVITASTPLPRKQIKPYGNLSYRTTDAINYQLQQPMSKSFSISSKREEHQSASSLSTTSKSESVGLDDTDFSPPSSTYLTHFNKPNKTINTVKSKPLIINTNSSSNRPKQSPTLKKPMVSFRSYTHSSKDELSTPSTSDSQLSKQGKSLHPSIPCTTLNKNKVTPVASTNKSVPPVPPRKSSIPRPALTPQLPQRNASTPLSLRRPQISHL